MENVVCAIYKLSINKIISDKWKNPPTNNTLMKTKITIYVGAATKIQL